MEQEASAWGLSPKGVGAAMGRWSPVKLGTLSLLGGCIVRQISPVIHSQAIGSAKVNPPAVLENPKLVLWFLQVPV